MKRPPKITVEEFKRYLFDERLSLQDIGERYGISRQAVWQRAKALGVDTSEADRPKPIRRRVPYSDPQAIVRLYTEKWHKVPEIAKALGITQKEVRLTLKDQGVALSRGGSVPWKYQTVRALKVGEYADFPKVDRYKSHVYYYHLAKQLGYRVSCETMGDVLRVTRIA